MSCSVHESFIDRSQVNLIKFLLNLIWLWPVGGNLNADKKDFGRHLRVHDTDVFPGSSWCRHRSQQKIWFEIHWGYLCARMPINLTRSWSKILSPSAHSHLEKFDFFCDEHLLSISKANFGFLTIEGICGSHEQPQQNPIKKGDLSPSHLN